jgi:dipeptidyl aminopeptidase/acylaminoacyl peptidase
MKGIRLLLLCFSFFTSSAYAYEQNITLLNTSDNQTIEIFIKEPQEKSEKLLLFLHGASMQGLRGIKPFWFNHWLSKGYAVSAVSLPGYGETTGVKDFCGPFTLKTLSEAIDFIKERVEVSEFGIIGCGLGSLAGLLSTADRTDVRCIVCANGVYDLMKHLAAGDPLLEIIQVNHEVELTEEAFKMRSPLEHISSLNTPAFLLHREGNPYVSEVEVLGFVEAMHNAGQECLCTIIKKTPESDIQKIHYSEILRETEEWIDQHMGN